MNKTIGGYRVGRGIRKILRFLNRVFYEHAGRARARLTLARELERHSRPRYLVAGIRTFRNSQAFNNNAGQSGDLFSRTELGRSQVVKQKKQKEQKKKAGQINLSYYAVGFFDLLGQQDCLRNLHSLPNLDDPTDVDRVRQSLRETYGAVMGMRKWFTDAFNGFARATGKVDISMLTGEQRKLFSQFRNNPIKTQQFSDSFVVYMSLITRGTDKLPTRGIYGILGGAAITFICCLAAGHPVRGGIDVGIGFEPSRGEIYGQALSRAVTLESSIADYPRIAVGSYLVRYLQDMQGQPAEDASALVLKATAQRSLDCLAFDDDGQAFLDYLGHPYRDTFGDTIDVKVIQMAYDRIMQALAEFQDAGDTKLVRRYTLLRNYFEDRLPIWSDLIDRQDTGENEC